MKQPIDPSQPKRKPERGQGRQAEADVLSIGTALLKWCHPRCISAWNDASRALSDFRLERRIQIEVPTPATLANAAALQALWEANERALVSQCARAHSMLENDLRWRLSNRTLFARGFLIRAGVDAGSFTLPHARAGDFTVDAFRSIVVDGADRYLAVGVACQPFTDPEPSQSTAAPLAPPDVAPRSEARPIEDLSDDDLLTILQRYLDRVAASPDAKLREPGKFSLLPFIARKMRDRAATGELLTSVSEEADWLAAWIEQKVEGHPKPRSKTISKVLGREYAQLKARSNAAIQKLNR
jgi:hypothetical protein